MVHSDVQDKGSVIEPGCRGRIYQIEFIDDDTRDEWDRREPGTYVMIKVPDESRWCAGDVIITYLPPAHPNDDRSDSQYVSMNQSSAED